MISNLENCSQLVAETIGQNICELREAAHLSRRDLAHLMGITYQQLYKYERGQNNISAENIVYLKFYLGADYNDFFKGLF